MTNYEDIRFDKQFNKKEFLELLSELGSGWLAGNGMLYYPLKELLREAQVEPDQEIIDQLWKYFEEGDDNISVAVAAMILRMMKEKDEPIFTKLKKKAMADKVLFLSLLISALVQGRGGSMGFELLHELVEVEYRYAISYVLRETYDYRSILPKEIFKKIMTMVEAAYDQYKEQLVKPSIDEIEYFFKKLKKNKKTNK